MLPLLASLAESADPDRYASQRLEEEATRKETGLLKRWCARRVATGVLAVRRV
jgi:hypothetical protein